MYSLLTKETVYFAWACEILHGFSLANFYLSMIIGIKKYAPEELIATS